MRFRPCIDIHNGAVKQIVGGSLSDEGDRARENFVAQQDAAWFARFYAADHLTGGHVILLNSAASPYYEKTKAQAVSALKETPKALMLGGGVNPWNAEEFLDAGASHVIVTSYVFKGGQVNEEHLDEMVSSVGREHLVLDLSCRKKNGRYFIVTDRWQKFTETELTGALLVRLAAYCSEYLVHAADVEGKLHGPDRELAQLLAEGSPLPVTYAGGVGSYQDLDVLRSYGKGKVDVTVGSALSIFGGPLDYRKVLSFTDR